MPPMDERLGMPAYMAPQLPEITPPVPPPSAVQPGYQQGGGPTSAAGGIAGMGASFLQGWMRGKSTAEANKAIKLKRQSDNMQAVYNMAADNLKKMHESGADPNSDEYKQAVSAVQGAWDGLMGFYGQHVAPQDDGKKKSKMKKIEGGLAGMFTSQDPAQISQAYLQLMQKMGPPVLHQLQGGPSSQDYKRQKDITTGKQDIELQDINDQKRYSELAGKARTGQLSETESREYQGLQAKFEKPGDPKKAAQDAIYTKIQQDPNYKLTDNDRIVLGLNPKTQVHVTGRGEVIATTEDSTGAGSYKVLRGPQAEYQPHGRGGAKTGAGSNRYEKTYKQAYDFYKQQYPEMDAASIEDLARRKAEGSQSRTVEEIERATEHPEEATSDILDEARSRMLKMKKYRDFDKWAGVTGAKFNDAFANIVGLDEESDRFAYNKNLGQPDKHGLYSGAVNQEKLKEFERDLQANIRDTMESMGLPKGLQTKLMQQMMPMMHLQGSAKSQAPSGDKQQPTIPKEAAAQLQEGQETTFANGQVWTKVNGKPQFVRGPE